MQTAAHKPERVGQAIVDEFCDMLWLEDGLSKNTLEAYKRDLLLFADWLHTAQSKSLYETTGTDLNAYFAFRHASSKASSSNRRLAVLKRFFQYGLLSHCHCCGELRVLFLCVDQVFR